jgi:hypothetical protein
VPLTYQGILETLDIDTQVAVSTAYLELCQLAGKKISDDGFEPARHRIARLLLQLAQSGERDPETRAMTSLAEIGTN